MSISFVLTKKISCLCKNLKSGKVNKAGLLENKAGLLENKAGLLENKAGLLILRPEGVCKRIYVIR